MRQKISKRLKKLFRTCVDYMNDSKSGAFYTSSVSHSFETGHVTEYYAASREDDGWVIDHVIGRKKMRCLNTGGHTNLINTDRETALSVLKNLEMRLRNMSEDEFIAEINNEARSYSKNHIISVIRRAADKAPDSSRTGQTPPPTQTPGA